MFVRIILQEYVRRGRSKIENTGTYSSRGLQQTHIILVVRRMYDTHNEPVEGGSHIGLLFGGFLTALTATATTIANTRGTTFCRTGEKGGGNAGGVMMDAGWSFE